MYAKQVRIPDFPGGAPVGYDKHVRTVELKSTEKK